MRRIIFFLTIGFTFVAGLGTSRAALVISEFMAENDGGLVDQDGDTPDWIELQNDGALAVDLAGWRLTDSATKVKPIVRKKMMRRLGDMGRRNCSAERRV